MTLPYYFDEDTVDSNLVEAARSRGLDVIIPLEAGMLHRSDEEHLQFATERGRVIYSFNVGDFCRIHSEWLRAGKVHAGILLAVAAMFDRSATAHFAAARQRTHRRGNAKPTRVSQRLDLKRGMRAPAM